MTVVNMVIPKIFFKLIGQPKHWEHRRTCFKCNGTGHIARYYPKNDDDRKNDEKESDAEINGLFIGNMICEPFDEEISEMMNEKEFE